MDQGVQSSLVVPTTITAHHARSPAIALLSNQTLFRQGVHELLRDGGFERITEFASGNELRAAAAKRAPDIVIIDLDHTGEDTIDLAGALRRDLPDAQLVAIGTAERQAATDSSIDRGVETPEADARELTATTAGGGKPPSVTLIRERRRWREVTSRQRDVMRWLAIGLDNQEIAAKLHIGDRAVKAHNTGLLDAFHVTNRTQLALLAARAGLRPPG
jgi:DNA-binding NarL/FixJ family response regulator